MLALMPKATYDGSLFVNATKYTLRPDHHQTTLDINKSKYRFPSIAYKPYGNEK
jgi:hypothetical protein